MAGLLNTYVPSAVTIVISHPATNTTHAVGGYGEDTFVNLELPQETWTEKESIDGDTTRSHHMTKTIRATVTLSQASRSNDVFSAIHRYDANDVTGGGIFTCTITDKSGRSYAYSSQCYLKRPQNTEFAQESGTRQWIIVMAGSEQWTGGNGKVDTDTAAVLAAFGVTLDPTWTST